MQGEVLDLQSRDELAREAMDMEISGIAEIINSIFYYIYFIVIFLGCIYISMMFKKLYVHAELVSMIIICIILWVLTIIFAYISVGIGIEHILLREPQEGEMPK